MYRQRHSSFVHSIFSGIRLDPFFKICVRRNHLIEDALIAVCYHASFLPQASFLSIEDNLFCLARISRYRTTS